MMQGWKPNLFSFQNFLRAFCSRSWWKKLNTMSVKKTNLKVEPNEKNGNYFLIFAIFALSEIWCMGYRRNWHRRTLFSQKRLSMATLLEHNRAVVGEKREFEHEDESQELAIFFSGLSGFLFKEQNQVLSLQKCPTTRKILFCLGSWWRN